MAIRDSGRRYDAACRLVRGDSVELRTAVSCCFANRAVHRVRGPRT